MTNQPMELSPIHFLFHGTPGSMISYKKSVMPHLLNAAKMLIPRHWKQNTRPSLMEWKKEVNSIMEAERWVYKSRDRTE